MIEFGVTVAEIVQIVVLGGGVGQVDRGIEQAGSPGRLRPGCGRWDGRCRFVRSNGSVFRCRRSCSRGYRCGFPWRGCAYRRSDSLRRGSCWRRTCRSSWHRPGPGSGPFRETRRHSRLRSPCGRTTCRRPGGLHRGRTFFPRRRKSGSWPGHRRWTRSGRSSRWRCRVCQWGFSGAGP